MESAWLPGSSALPTGRAERLIGADLDVSDQIAGAGHFTGKRGTLPADRRQRAGADLGYQARPHDASFANQAYVDFVGLPFEEAITFDWAQGAASG